MPAPHPPEFRRRAVDLVRLGEKPVAQIAKDLGISGSCLRNWMAKDDVDAGRKEGLSSDERALAKLASATNGVRGPPARAFSRRPMLISFTSASANPGGATEPGPSGSSSESTNWCATAPRSGNCCSVIRRS